MLIIKSQKEFDEQVKDGIFNYDGHVKFECDIKTIANIKARNINARDIKAWDIEARDIKAYDIEAENISYYAFCISYQDIECKSIKGRRENCFHKALDGDIIIKKRVITFDGKDIELSEESYQNLKKKFEG
jgi:hypothetical protein